MPTTKLMQRSRIDTENRLIAAVGQLIALNGLHEIGINRIASHSGINKILIYRYFGGLDGLLQAYYARTKPIISLPPIDVAALKELPLSEIFDVCYQHIIDEFRLLRQNPEAQEFLKADLLNNSGLSSLLAEEKAAALLKMVDELGNLIGSTKGRPFALIIVSAMTLLTFMGEQKRVVMGIDVGSDEGWAEIESALKNIYHGGYLLTQERQANEQRAATNSAEETT